MIPFGTVRAERGEALRVAQELDDLGQLRLRLVAARDVGPGDRGRRLRLDLLRLGPRHQPQRPPDEEHQQPHEDDRGPRDDPVLDLVPGEGDERHASSMPCGSPSELGSRPHMFVQAALTASLLLAPPPDVLSRHRGTRLRARLDPRGARRDPRAGAGDRRPRGAGRGPHRRRAALRRRGRLRQQQRRAAGRPPGAAPVRPPRRRARRLPLGERDVRRLARLGVPARRALRPPRDARRGRARARAPPPGHARRARPLLAGGGVLRPPSPASGGGPASWRAGAPPGGRSSGSGRPAAGASSTTPSATSRRPGATRASRRSSGPGCAGCSSWTDRRPSGRVGGADGQSASHRQRRAAGTRRRGGHAGARRARGRGAHAPGRARQRRHGAPGRAARPAHARAVRRAGAQGGRRQGAARPALAAAQGGQRGRDPVHRLPAHVRRLGRARRLVRGRRRGPIDAAPRRRGPGPDRRALLRAVRPDPPADRRRGEGRPEARGQGGRALDGGRRQGGRRPLPAAQDPQHQALLQPARRRSRAEPGGEGQAHARRQAVRRARPVPPRPPRGDQAGDRRGPRPRRAPARRRARHRRVRLPLPHRRVLRQPRAHAALQHRGVLGQEGPGLRPAARELARGRGDARRRHPAEHERAQEGPREGARGARRGDRAGQGARRDPRADPPGGAGAELRRHRRAGRPRLGGRARQRPARAARRGRRAALPARGRRRPAPRGRADGAGQHHEGPHGGAQDPQGRCRPHVRGLGARRAGERGRRRARVRAGQARQEPRAHHREADRQAGAVRLGAAAPDQSCPTPQQPEADRMPKWDYGTLDELLERPEDPRGAADVRRPRRRPVRRHAQDARRVDGGQAPPAQGRRRAAHLGLAVPRIIAWLKAVIGYDEATLFKRLRRIPRAGRAGPATTCASRSAAARRRPARRAGSRPARRGRPRAGARPARASRSGAGSRSRGA